MALVQIHMFAYNEERFIEQAVRGVLNQSFADFELVVHDNKSTDRTLAICREIAATDSRMVLNEAAFNAGAIPQWWKIGNSGAAKYIAMRSANDALHPDYYKETTRILESDPSVGLAYSLGRTFSEDPGDAQESNPAFRIDTRGLDSMNACAEVMRRYTLSFPLWGVYRRECLEKCRPYPFVYGGDHILVAELALYGHVAPTLDELDFRREGRALSGDVMVSNTKSQMEESVRGVGESSYYYGVKQILPFVDMAWGHLHMLSLARIGDAEKNALSLAAVDILRARFGMFMEAEVQRFLALLGDVLNGLGSQDLSRAFHVFTWVQKARRELEKIRALGLRTGDELRDLDSKIWSQMTRL